MSRYRIALVLFILLFSVLSSGCSKQGSPEINIRPEIRQEAASIVAAIDQNIREGNVNDPNLKQRAFDLLYVNTFKNMSASEVNLMSVTSRIFQSYCDFEGSENSENVFQEYEETYEEYLQIIEN
jgi:hypothetical protein